MRLDDLPGSSRRIVIYMTNASVHKCEPTDPKMTLGTAKSYISHIRCTSNPKSQILIRFSLRSSVFELLAILRRAQWMTPKGPWALQGYGYPLYGLLVTIWSTNLNSICSITSRVGVTGHFETDAPNDSKLTLSTKRSKCTTYTFYKSPRVPGFTRFYSTASHFEVTGHFEKSAPNDPKEPLTLKAQIYPYVVYL